MKADSRSVPLRAPPGADIAAYKERASNANSAERKLLEVVIEIFEERPLWIRPALVERIWYKTGALWPSWWLQRALQAVGFSWESGPFRGAHNKLGFDPRPNPAMGKYQVVDFRDQRMRKGNLGRQEEAIRTGAAKVLGAPGSLGTALVPATGVDTKAHLNLALVPATGVDTKDVWGERTAEKPSNKRPAEDTNPFKDFSPPGEQEDIMDNKGSGALNTPPSKRAKNDIIGGGGPKEAPPQKLEDFGPPPPELQDCHLRMPPTNRSVIYQLCDLEDTEIQDLVKKRLSEAKDFDPVTGFLTKQCYAAIRNRMQLRSALLRDASKMGAGTLYIKNR